MLLREGHVDEHIRFGVADSGGELRHLQEDLVGAGQPLDGNRCSQATSLSGAGRIGPGQEIADLVLRMTGDDAGDDLGEVGIRVDAIELRGFDQRGDCGEYSPPPSEPADSALFRLRAIDLIERSTTLESSRRGRRRGSDQVSRPARERVTDCLGELALLADEGEPLAQPTSTYPLLPLLARSYFLEITAISRTLITFSLTAF